jgi:hypothetical protein
MKRSKMKIKVPATVFAVVFATGLFSCQNDLLNPVPETQVDEAFVFDTPQRVALQVNNLYSSVKSGQFLGGRAMIYGDIRANDFLNRTSNGVTGYLVWQHTLTEQSQNDVINMWRDAYQAINQINVFLEGIDAFADKMVPPLFTANYNTTTAVQYKAEARFLRAVSYHYLLMFYARPYADGNGSRPGLPLRLKGERDLLGNDLARATVAQVYDQIIDDLNYAETNLPLTYSTSLLRVTRAHRNTAIAFKTRVLLTKGDYAGVITEANKIVSLTSGRFIAATGVPHTLQDSIKNVFDVPQETSESIFSMPFSAQNPPGIQNQLGFYYRSSSAASVNPGGGEFSLNTSSSATSGGITGNTTLFPAQDARRRHFVYTVGAERFLGKYPSGTPFLDKAPVIRYAEVLLNLAEARARTIAGDAQATDLVNAIRVRATLPPIVAPTGTELIDEIMLQRRIEFLGEGLRNQDIMRLNQPFPAKGAVPGLAVNSAIYAWPIPAPEMATNTLMVRNE